MICPRTGGKCRCLTPPDDCIRHCFISKQQPAVHKCPVCEGRGQLYVDVGYKVCHGCDGKGWVKSVNGNPIEDLIAKFRLLGQPSDAGDEAQEWTYRKCADLLEASINPYRQVAGPPTEPGDYWVKWSDFGFIVPMHVAVLGLLPENDQIEWHCKVMPPFGEAGE